MIRLAATVSLVPEAVRGPFLFHGDFPAALAAIKPLGFDGVELFPPEPEAIPSAELRLLLEDSGLELAAVGTGAGWLRHRLSVTDPDPAVRQRALDFVLAMIDYAAGAQAPVILGSMQGRAGDRPKPEALDLLGAALSRFGMHAAGYGLHFLYEPLNRYESDLLNTLEESARFLAERDLKHVRLLADLFHANIEEASLASGLQAAGRWVGHVHFADSNRRPAGLGHTRFGEVAEALAAIDYQGYVSAEAFPYPDSHAAARITADTFRRTFLGRRDGSA
jgi:sugar phosphate isomerase/epimerase